MKTPKNFKQIMIVAIIIFSVSVFSAVNLSMKKNVKIDTIDSLQLCFNCLKKDSLKFSYENSGQNYFLGKKYEVVLTISSDSDYNVISIWKKDSKKHYFETAGSIIENKYPISVYTIHRTHSGNKKMFDSVFQYFINKR